MAYIIDLTCIMQIIFLLTAVRPSSEVTDEVVCIAMKAYEDAQRSEVHADIENFDVGLAFAHERQDAILDKIKDLIFKYRVSDDQVAELRRQLQ